MYRIGATLADALDTLIVDQRIQPQLAMKILANFDRVTSEKLKSDVNTKMSFKGHLSTYRFCDDVWTFVIKDVVMKLDDGESLDVGKFKIVACNSKKSGEI